MANYPTLNTMFGGDPEYMPGIIIDRSMDGTGHARAYTPDKCAIRLSHLLTSAEIETLMAFYDANRLAAFSYTSPSDGLARTMLFSGRPRLVREPNEDGLFRVDVSMEEV